MRILAQFNGAKRALKNKISTSKSYYNTADFIEFNLDGLVSDSEIPFGDFNEPSCELITPCGDSIALIVDSKHLLETLYYLHVIQMNFLATLTH